jgi:uncharacterized membrane protein
MVQGPMKDLLEGKKYPTDLLLVLCFSVITLVLVLALPDGNIIRIIFGIPFLIFFPGYSLVSLLWPEKRTLSVTGIDENLERIALAFGLSIAIVSLIGLGLHYTSIGITFSSTLFGNFAITLLLLILAYYQRNRVPIENRYAVNFALSTKMPEERTEKAFVVAIIFILIISSFTLTFVLLRPVDKYTTFYILDENMSVEYPENFTVNDTVSVNVGVVNHEDKTSNYRIVAGFVNHSNLLYIGHWNVVFILNDNASIARNVTLENNEIFEEPFTFQIPEPGRYQLVWQLFIDNIPTDYEVHLWVNVNAD